MNAMTTRVAEWVNEARRSAGLLAAPAGRSGRASRSRRSPGSSRGNQMPRADTLEQAAQGLRLGAATCAPRAAEGEDRSLIRQWLSMIARREGRAGHGLRASGSASAMRQAGAPGIVTGAVRPAQALGCSTTHEVRYIVIGGFAGRAARAPPWRPTTSTSATSGLAENMDRLAAALRQPGGQAAGGQRRRGPSVHPRRPDARGR